jgi:hypothetical protein
MLLELSPDLPCAGLLVKLNVSQVVGVAFSFDVLEQAGLEQNISLERVKENQFEAEVLKEGLSVLFLELVFIDPLVLFRDEHEVLLLDIFIDDFDFSLSSFEDWSFHVGIHVDVHSNLVVLLSVDHGGDIEDVVAHLSLLGLEKAVEFKQAHHLASAIVELNQDNALVFE